MTATRIARSHPDELIIGLVSVSDRASSGAYQDQGLPALREWLGGALASPWQAVDRLIPDEPARISETLIELVDGCGCDLVLTTGGTGPARRDVTPEATLAVATKEMPGFGEQMRQISLRFVPTAILSRQTAGIRGRTLMITIPGKPAAIATCLDAVFAAVPYCLDLIGAARIETDPARIKAFRPGA